MVTANRHLFYHLFQIEGINLKYGSFLDKSPGPGPQDFDFKRIEGMMLGQAIGDDLGNTTAGRLPGDRMRICGEIRGYLPNCWYSAAFLLGRVPTIIFILMRRGDVLEEALIRAVNDTKDNDPLAAIFGAAKGGVAWQGQAPKQMDMEFIWPHPR